jgi:hypothetical protein
MTSRRRAIVDVDSEDSDLGSPFSTLDDSVPGASASAGTSNDAIGELSTFLARTKLIESDGETGREDKPVQRRPPLGRKAPSLYDTSSDDDNNDGDDDDESISSVEDSAAVAPKARKVALRRDPPKTGTSSLVNHRASTAVGATTSTSHPLRTKHGVPRDSISSLGDDSSSTGSDDDSIVSRTVQVAKKSTNLVDGVWSYDKLRNEYTIAGGASRNFPALTIPSEIYDKLYDFQKDGVTWMAGLHAGKIGGVLGKNPSFRGGNKFFHSMTN